MRRRKGDINPNLGFVKELQQYEKVANSGIAPCCGCRAIGALVCD